MQYLILGTIAVITVFLVIHRLNKIREKKQIQQIREAWGKPKSESFHFVSIQRYADAVKEKFHRLTDQTMEDIDFNRLFAFIDRTTSKVGQQFLFKKVIEPTNHPEDQSAELIQLFAKDKNLREEIQLKLLKLSNHDAYYIPLLLWDSLLVEEPKWFKLLTLDVIIVACLVDMFSICPPSVKQ